MRALKPLLLASLALLWVGCGDDDTTDAQPDAAIGGEAGSSGEAGAGGAPQTGEEARSLKARDLAPDVDDADLDQVAAGEAAFGLALYQEIKGEPGNIFFSPYSIAQAMAMTWGGARGETADEIQSALRFPLEQGRFHPAFNALDLELETRSELAEYEEGDGFELSIVNATWAQVDRFFLDSFLDLLAVSYGAGLRLLDFATDPERARETINAWVEDQTRERIKDLLPPGSIGTSTALVLTNAIYFKASWADKFAEHGTEEAPFYLLDGGEATAPLMIGESEMRYGAGDGYQIFSIPYVGHQVSMTVILPDEGRFAEIEAGLDEETLAQMLDARGHETLRLRFPKFEFTQPLGLKPVLMAMGVDAAFNNADFSGIDGTRSLFISDVLHKAFVAVDEEGTEAAAATAVIFNESASEPIEPIEVRADRPFIFTILDEPTGAVLFMGRFVEP